MKWHRLRTLLRSLFRRRRYLCDTCLYDHPSSCRMPFRPNATLCEDYVKRGTRKEPLGKPPNLKL